MNVGNIHDQVLLNYLQQLVILGAVTSMVKEPFSAEIRVVANLCKYEYKYMFFRDRQKGSTKSTSEIISF